MYNLAITILVVREVFLIPLYFADFPDFWERELPGDFIEDYFQLVLYSTILWVFGRIEGHKKLS